MMSHPDMIYSTEYSHCALTCAGVVALCVNSGYTHDRKWQTWLAATGDFCRELTARGHLAIGFDFSMGMLRAADCPEARMVHADVLALPLVDASMDGATCGFALRNLVSVQSMFAELARVVRPGGRIGLLEVSEPTNPVMQRGHRIYFNRIVPLIGSVLSDSSAYRYLPRSVAYLPSPDDLMTGLKSVGFKQIEHKLLTGGIVQLLTATRS